MTRGIEPLAKPKKSTLIERPEAPEPASPPKAEIAPFRVGQAASRNSTADLGPVPKETVQIDKKKLQQLRRGKGRPDAKLDLHGMTLSEAHGALIDFVLAAQARGDRLVLVITGKGKTARSDGPIPPENGLLRTQVPNWLGLPPLAAVVLDQRPAHLRHGGGGAIYVSLRRRRSLRTGA